MSSEQTLTVLLATIDRWADVAAAFGRRGRDPSTCWCQRFIGDSAGGDNRAALLRQIETAPVPFGLIAYLGDAPVGWSRISPRAELPGVLKNRAIQRLVSDDPDAWWVTCFSVDARARGRGVGRALLNAAVEHARANGASAVEGHPVDVSGLQAEKVSGSALFTGTMAMFVAAGFSEIGRTYPTRPVMRLEL